MAKDDRPWNDWLHEIIAVISTPLTSDFDCSHMNLYEEVRHEAPEVIVPALRAALGHPDRAIQLLALEVLVTLDVEASPAFADMIALFASPDEEVRRQAVGAFGVFGTFHVRPHFPTFLPALLRAMDDASPEIRIAACAAAAETLQDERFWRAGESPDPAKERDYETLTPEARAGVAADIERVTARVTALAAARPVDVAVAAIRALEKLALLPAERRALGPILLKRVRRGRDDVAEAALRLLDELAGRFWEAQPDGLADALPDILARLDRGGGHVRFRAIKLLGTLHRGGPDVIRRLVACFTDGRGRYEQAAVDAVRAFPSDEAVPILIEAVADPRPMARAACLVSLAENGRTARPDLRAAALAAIQAGAGDPDEAVRKRAALALSHIERPRPQGS